MNYPTAAEIEAADRYQICKWWRFLPSANANDEVQLALQNRIAERYKQLGGMTPEISKSLGWNKPV